MRSLDAQLTGVQALADTIIDLTFSVADINPPWRLEEWAREVTDKYKTAEIPKNMTLSYLRIVNEFLSQPDNNKIFFNRSLLEQGAPSTQLSYYWNKAEEWKRATEEHYGEGRIKVIGEVDIDRDGNVSAVREPEPLRIVKERVNEYRPKVEAWLASHPNS